MNKFRQDGEIIEKEHLYESSSTTLLLGDNVVEKLKHNTDYENPSHTGSYIVLCGRLKCSNYAINVKNKDNKCSLSEKFKR